MADFNMIYPHVRDQEGGYTTSPHETYAGIDRKENPGWNGWALVDKYKPLKQGQKINDADLENRIKAFYQQEFLRINGAEIINDGIGLAVFDFFINAGNNAIKQLQKVLNTVFGNNLVVDGDLGVKTLQALNKADTNSLLSNYSLQRVNYYKNIALGNPENEGFLKTWLKRTADILSIAKDSVPAGGAILFVLITIGVLIYLLTRNEK